MDMLEPTENERAVMVILGYTFNNVQLLRTALQTWSAVFPYGNKRLALVGDKLLGLVFHLDGYPTTDNCAQMTMRLNTRASNSYLATVGGAVGLARYVRINPAQQGDISPSTMATTVEALIGAVYLDSEPDLSDVKAVMIRLGIMDAEE